MKDFDAHNLAPVKNAGLQDDFAKRRDIIDMIATTRAKTIRVGLFGRMIFLPDPRHAKDQDHMAKLRDVLQDQVHQIQDVKAVITGTYTKGDISADLLEWVLSLAKNMPEEVAEISMMSKLSDDVIDACDQGGTALENALEAHMLRGRAGFHEVVTRFCNGLWTDLDAAREEKAAKAAQSSQAVYAILSRLEYVGKHVRLVSLNASVEAARAGDAGRGLAVIATEFKNLAEEIQALAKTARDEIDEK